METCGQPADDLARDAERRDPRDEREARHERAAPEALLQVLGEGEEQRVVAAGRDRQRRQSERDRSLPSMRRCRSGDPPGSKGRCLARVVFETI
jgi:hypothetical protein